MDIFWEELTSGLPNGRQLVHVIIRLVAATLLGALVGTQRERAGKPAGLRTHILVTLGTAVFVHCDRHRLYRSRFHSQVE
jgi:putative Mg2+ transporter-C (MgtC) family protein